MASACVFILCAFLAISCTNGVRVGHFFNDLQTTSNPDTYLTPPKVIRRHGYPAETHIVQSADGYLLELHRIPHGKSNAGSQNRLPVFLHHGLLCSSFDWIINGPEKSLSYKLADLGYDVWMANARGNTYSRSHITMNPTQREFWNFSFHEMGYYDLPAAIDYVLNTTDHQKLLYIGHSLGTTTFFVMTTTRPEYNDKIIAQISLAPIAYMNHTTSAFRYLVPYAERIRSMSDWYDKGAFLEHDIAAKIVLKLFCGKAIFNYNICEQLIIFSLFGKDVEQFNSSLIPVISSNLPAGTSGKNMIHCAQTIRYGGFRYYDYGLKENILRYKSATPPSYDFSKISTPVKFYYGENDILADPLDVKMLYQQIPKPMGLHRVDYDKFNHVDFIWAKDVNRLLNRDLLEFVQNMTTDSGFIQEVVAQATEIRINTPPPTEEEFDEESFFKKFGSLPGLSSIKPGIPNLTEIPQKVQKKFEDGINTFNTGISQAVNTTKVQLDGAVHGLQNEAERTARKIKTSVGEAVQKVDSTIKNGVEASKDAVEKAAKEWHDKMKDAMDKLGQFFG